MKPGAIAITISALLAIIGGYVWAIHRSENVRSSAPVSTPLIEHNADASTLEQSSKTNHPAFDAVQKAISSAGSVNEPSPFPPGTKLIGVSLENGMVTVNLSSEFRKLDQMGNTGESNAQKSLCNALAGFKQIKKMRVTIEGEIYQGEHYGEWTDIPVREETR